MSGIIIGIIVAIAIVGVAALLVLLSLAGNLLFICEPNEVLIFSGRSGQKGYRYVRGGRAWRTPLLEKVDRLDLTNMIIDLQVNGAYSKGGIPLNVQGVANIKIAGHEPVLDHAVERLLGKGRNDIMQIAKDVLEGNLRGVLAKLTPEEVNDDKLAFAENLQEEAELDLAALGLILDNMKIQNVSDDRGYLDSIGRKKSADLVKRARVAEAEAKANANVREAENRQRARLKEIFSKRDIIQAESDRRFNNAKSRAKAMVAEAQGQVKSEIARTEAAILAATATVEQTRQRLEADIIAPAEANMEAGISDAQGNAAQILEDGRATVTVLQEMITVWKGAGPNARDIFLMQKMDKVMESLVSTIGTVKIDRMTMLPKTNGADSTSIKAVRLVEELKAAVGVDIPQLIQQMAVQSNGSGSDSSSA